MLDNALVGVLTVDDGGTITEGVETAGQATALRALGCPLAQGYHYARPLDEPQLDRYLRQRGRALADEH